MGVSLSWTLVSALLQQPSFINNLYNHINKGNFRNSNTAIQNNTGILLYRKK